LLYGCVACLFHTTAFLFCGLLFLNRNFKTVTVVFVLIISFMIGKQGLPLFVFIGGYWWMLGWKNYGYSDGAKMFWLNLV
jgi:hypothetical protein